MPIVNSIAMSITTYWARIYILPTKLISMINKALNHCFWHGDPHLEKLIPTAFKRITRSKAKEGFGIIILSSWNKAAASKLVNSLLYGVSDLWTQWTLQNRLKIKFLVDKDTS